MNEIAALLRNLKINIVLEVDPTKVVQKSKSQARKRDPPSRPSGEVEEVLVAGPSRRQVNLLFGSWTLNLYLELEESNFVLQEQSPSDPYKMPPQPETRPPPGHVLRSTNNLAFCQRLINRIMKFQEAAPFIGPVDPLRLALFLLAPFMLC